MNKFFSNLLAGLSALALSLAPAAQGSTFNQFFGNSAPMQGAPFIGYDTGVAYMPHYVVDTGAPLTTTATRAYYIPYFVSEAITFASIRTYNSGAGDNGDTYRLAVYANDGTAGPGTLIQDIGQSTLTGASAERTITATINLQAYAGQWVWVMFHANQAAAMFSTTASSVAGDYLNGTGILGTMAAGLEYVGNNANSAFRYVDTAYGAAAATAVTPTLSASVVPVFVFVK